MTIRTLFVAAVFVAAGCRTTSDLDYWEERAKKHGARSVINLGHTEAEMDAVTRKQIDILFPILQRHLRGDEKTLLDFGSGSGRFTIALAKVIGGRAIGVDPIQRLLDLSPGDPNVEYKLLKEGRIPLPDDSVDVVWISLVLGTITDERELRLAITEVERVLKDDGLLFLVENTADKPDLKHFAFRTIDEYRAMFPSIALTHEGDYDDLGERISIFAGRLRPARTEIRSPASS